MKKITLLLIAGLVCTFAFAQEEMEKQEVVPAKNMIKINLPALVLKNISIQYERKVARKVTVAGTFRYMPKSSIPLKSTFIDLADDAEFERQVDGLKVGNVAFMPEVRYYLSKKGAFRGVYLGLFGNISSFSADVPIEYDNGSNTEVIPMSGKLNGLTGGLMIGTQFKLSKRLNLDWWILGPNYGTSKGNLTGKKTMDAIEQQSLRDELANLEIPLTDFTYEVNGNGATVNFDGPWGGVRAGICLGFKF